MDKLMVTDVGEQGLEEGLEVFAERFGSDRCLAERAKLRARWRRTLFENPFATRTLPGRLWLARQGDRAVGVLLGVPFRARNGDRTFDGYWGVDLYVRRVSRGCGAGATLLSRWRDASPVALGLGITDPAFRIERSLGWSPKLLPGRYVRLLSSRGAIVFSAQVAANRLSGKEGHRPWRPLWQGRTPPPNDADTSTRKRVSKTCHLPDDADRLLECVSRALPWHVVRDRAGLEWRYGSWAKTDSRFLLLGPPGRLSGLSIFRLDRRRYLCKAWIHELLFDPRHLETGSRLVAATLAAAQGQGADIAECRMTASFMGPIMTEQGFFLCGDRERFIIHSSLPDLSSDALASAGWSLTLGDSGNL